MSQRSRKVFRAILLAGILSALPITFSGTATDSFLPTVKASDACGQEKCCVPEPFSFCPVTGQINTNLYSKPDC
jgi:hypothetical protein